MTQDLNAWLKRNGIKIKRTREERLAMQIWQACRNEIAAEKDNRIIELESLLKYQNEVLKEIKANGGVKE
jgi:hypothetical protein